MASRATKALKRAAASRPGSSSGASSPPPPPPSVPSALVRDKVIIPETTFALDGLRGAEDTAWTFEYLALTESSNILAPAGSVFHPRLVRIVYQSIRVDDSRQWASATIDGQTIRFDPALINATWELPDVDFDISDLDYSIAHLSQSLAPNRPESDLFVRRSELYRPLWFLDHIFYDNLWHQGQHQERRQPLLEALYCAHTGTPFSLGQVIFLAITRLAADIYKENRTGKSAPLLFPYLISAMLRKRGFRFRSDEPTSSASNVFTLSDWTKSHRSTRQAMEKRLLTRNPPPVQPPPAAAPSSSSQPPPYATTADFERLHSRMDQFDSRLVGYEDQGAHLSHMLQAMALQQGPEYYASWEEETERRQEEYRQRRQRGER